MNLTSFALEWLLEVKSAYKACKNPIKAMSVAKSLDIYSGGKTMKARFVNGMATYEYFWLMFNFMIK